MPRRLTLAALMLIASVWPAVRIYAAFSSDSVDNVESAHAVTLHEDPLWDMLSAQWERSDTPALTDDADSTDLVVSREFRSVGTDDQHLVALDLVDSLRRTGWSAIDADCGRAGVTELAARKGIQGPTRWALLTVEHGRTGHVLAVELSAGTERPGLDDRLISASLECLAE